MFNAIKSQLNAVLFSVWQFSINSFGFELSENEGSELDSWKKKHISLFYMCSSNTYLQEVMLAVGRGGRASC